VRAFDVKASRKTILTAAASANRWRASARGVFSTHETAIVSRNPDVMAGAAVFCGTRVHVQTLVDYIEAGETIDDFLEGFPTVTREQVIAFLEEAKARVTCARGGSRPSVTPTG
jgi:uncharacterized protein (DUF433 family)